MTGTGFLPDAPATNGTRPPLAGKFAGTYVVFGSFAENWQPSKDAPAGARVALDTKWAVHAADIATIGGAARGGIEVKPDGTFSTTLNLTKDEAKELEGGRYGIYTYAGGGVKYAPFETKTAIEFAPAHETTVEVEASTGALYAGDEVTFTATTSAEVSGSVQFMNNGVALGEPVEVVDAQATLATTALAAGENDVTAKFVPSNTDVFAASTSEPTTVTLAAQPVALINGTPSGDAKLNPGDVLELKVGPFVAGAEFKVEIHSDVVELPGPVGPDADGFVTASWTVPADFEVGTHDVVVTDTESGRVFAFENAFEVVAKTVTGGETGGENTGTTPPGPTSGTGTTGGTGSKALANSGSAPATAAFAAAGALLLLGAGVMLVRRRQGANAE